METRIDNGSPHSLPACWPTLSWDGAPHTLSWPPMIIHHFQVLGMQSFLFWFSFVYIFPGSLWKFYLFPICMGCSSVRKHLSYKKYPHKRRGIIDLHLFSRDAALHARIPKVPSHPSVLFTVALKPLIGAAIRFCPPLSFIYSPSLAIKPEIYDLLFN